MKKFTTLMTLTFLAFSGCSGSTATGDYDLGAPEDMNMETTGASAEFDPYKNVEPTGDHGATGGIDAPGMPEEM